MDILSHFCNICWKYDDKNLKNICERNMEHLKNTLITFIGHADIINNIICLCESCCETLIHFNKFRRMCLRNLVQFKQLYHNKISTLKLREKLDELFVERELGKSNTAAAASAYLQECIRNYSDVNQIESNSNSQIINIHSEKNECAFDNSQLEFTKNELQLNEMPTINSEQLKLQLLESKYRENVNLVLISQIAFQEKLHIKSETEKSTAEDFELEKIKIECSAGTNLNIASYEDVKYDSDEPIINNCQESDNSQIEFTENDVRVKEEHSPLAGLEVEKSGNECCDVFQISNVHTITNVQNYGTRAFRNEENAEVELNLRSRKCNSERWSTKCPTAQSSAMQEHLDPSAIPHMCGSDNKAFTNSFTLSSDKRTQCHGRSYKSTVGSKALAQLANLTKHIHSANRPYKCTVCNKYFIQLNHLTTHERIHSGERPYKCTVCNKAFTQLANLTKHQRIHSGDKPYKCIVCNKAFTTSSNLNVHERTHSGDKPHICNVCNRAFTQLAHLTKHVRIHSSVRP